MTMVDDKGNFSTAIEFWKNVNLVNLQRELDEQGLSIVENQKDGLVSRKKLAEQTREFKKIPDEEKLQQFKGLLKGYQSEIDNITRRTKYAENAFLTVYKLLADAPDPIPLFDAAVEQSVKLVDFEHSENENKQLKEQINKLQQENQRLSQIEEANKQLQQQNTQLKQTITKLEEKKKSEDLIQKENEMKAQYTNKIKSYKEREHDLQLQLNQALDQLTQLRATHDDTQAQLIGHNQKYDQEVVGKLAELDIIMMDLERANTRIVELENKNSDLKNEIRSLNETQEDNSTFAKSDLHTQHELEMNKLMKDVETYKDLLQKTEQRTSKKLKELTTEIKTLTEHSESLKTKIKDMEDYHEIKRELAIMKYVEFSTGGGDDDDDDNNNTFNAKEVLNKDSIQQSLEVQLMEKNKKLENEYTQLKVNHHELEASFNNNQTLLNELKTKVDDQQQLIQRLEEDLLQGIGKKSEDHSSTPPILQRNPSTSSLLDTRLSFDMSSSQQSPPQQQQSSKEEDKSILPIVMQQRDRFRQRNAELERHSRSLEQQLHDLRTEMDRLKEDNLKLYERLKFVHVWKEEQRNVNQSTIQMEPIGPSSRREFKKSLPTINDDPTDRYDKLYEENMNPFAQFHRKEERRRYNALNPADKLTLKMTRMMFSHKWTRYLLIVYALLLHLLVVTTLYQLSLWECRHDHETFNTPTNMNININE
ncbi:CASP C terminal-domain-containing protein [Cunninghamella echinulata]|nr:CASP C terminal-domain-containing protein [Cunninghamella echinulata]